MAEPDIRQFSPNALREIQRDHTRLKSLVTNLTRRQRVYDSMDSEPIRTITGITSTSTSHPTYPTSGNTYVVKLNDYYFTEATGTNSRTSAGTSSQYVIARTWDGSSVAQNTPVICDLIECRGQGFRWWIRPAASAGTTWPVVSCLLGMDYIMGGGGYVEYDKPGGWYVYDSYGNTSEIGFTPNNSRSAYTDWTFSLSQAGWYLWLLDWFPTNAYISGTATKTYTTSGPSTGAAHTHTVDVDRSYRLYGETWLERQAGGSGAWDYGVPSSEITAGMWERRIGYTWHSPQGGYSDGHDGSHNNSGSWSERAITANDRFRLTTWVWPDAWSVADGVTHKANNEMLAQLTIVRIGDNPS